MAWMREWGQGQMLGLSPPLNVDAGWVAQYGPYTTTKYAMTMRSMGMAYLVVV